MNLPSSFQHKLFTYYSDGQCFVERQGEQFVWAVGSRNGRRTLTLLLAAETDGHTV